MLKTSSDDEAMMTFMVAELPHPWQYPALDRMLDYRRSAVQSWVGVGTRDVQLTFARTLMRLGLVDNTVVIALKATHPVWAEYGKIYEDWNGPKITYFSQKTALLNSAYRGKDMQRTCFVIDVGVSGRMAAAVVNYELRAARWVSARQMQNIKLTELQPVLVTPVELGYEKGKFVKGGIGVAQE